MTNWFIAIAPVTEARDALVRFTWANGGNNNNTHFNAKQDIVYKKHNRLVFLIRLLGFTYYRYFVQYLSIGL